MTWVQILGIVLALYFAWYAWSALITIVFGPGQKRDIDD